jgi:hypothetical protein
VKTPKSEIRNPKEGRNPKSDSDGIVAIFGWLTRATTLSGLFPFSRLTQGSSHARNPGLKDGIPLGFSAARSDVRTYRSRWQHLGLRREAKRHAAFERAMAFHNSCISRACESAVAATLCRRSPKALAISGVHSDFALRVSFGFHPSDLGFPSTL